MVSFKGASKKARCAEFIGRGDVYKFVYIKGEFGWEGGRTFVRPGFTALEKREGMQA